MSEKSREMILTLFSDFSEIISCLGKLLKNPENMRFFLELYEKRSFSDTLTLEDKVNFLNIVKEYSGGKDFLKGTPFEYVAKNVPQLIDVLIDQTKRGGEPPRIKEIPQVYDE